MEKPSVSVTFQDVPESDSENASPKVSCDGTPRPFRSRAFTTGSLWEIINRARSSPTHGTGRGWIWNNNHFQDGSLRLGNQGKLITDYVHMERKNRRRHWSEFDAGGRQKEGPAQTSSSAINPVTSSEGFLKPSPECGSIPKPHEVQMRFDHRMTASKTNPNRNSLLANACISTSLQCLFSNSKRRAQSAPTDSEELNDFSGYPDSLIPYWRASPMSLSKGMSYLGESVRSISKCRKSSVNSTGSGDEEGGYRDGCLTPSGTFNVSSGSSISVPSYRILLLRSSGESNVDLLDTFTALGDADDDDVFVDDEGPERSAFISVDGEEYYLTFADATMEDIGRGEEADAYVVIHKNELEKTAAILDFVSKGQPNGNNARSACVLVLKIGSHRSDAERAEFMKLAEKHKVKDMEMISSKRSVAMDTLQWILVSLQQFAEQNLDGAARPQLPSRSRKLPGLSFHDVTVDKQTLFNRFFRRTLSTKSCDNLLAL